MTNDGVRHLYATAPRETQSEPQVDVFDITKKALIEPPNRTNRGGIIESAGGAGAESFAFRRNLRDDTPVASALGHPESKIGVACTVKPSRIDIVELRRSKHDYTRVPFGCPQ